MTNAEKRELVESAAKKAIQAVTGGFVNSFVNSIEGNRVVNKVVDELAPRELRTVDGPTGSTWRYRYNPDTKKIEAHSDSGIGWRDAGITDPDIWREVALLRCQPFEQ